MQSVLIPSLSKFPALRMAEGRARLRWRTLVVMFFDISFFDQAPRETFQPKTLQIRRNSANAVTIFYHIEIK